MKFSLLLLFMVIMVAPLLGQVELSDEEIKSVILPRVDERIQEFLELLEIIGDKSYEEWQKEAALERVLEFFVDRSAIIQVSSLRNPDHPKDFKAEDYFARLMAMDYDQVILDLDHLRTEELQSTGNRSYRTLGVYGQVFRGYYGEEKAYEDYTIKLISIRVLPADGYDDWHILFNSIMVHETRRNQ